MPVIHCPSCKTVHAYGDACGVQNTEARIATLEAENARLRGALQAVADNDEDCFEKVNAALATEERTEAATETTEGGE